MSAIEQLRAVWEKIRAIQIPKVSRITRTQWAILAGCVLVAVFAGVYIYLWRQVGKRLDEGVFAHTVGIYSAAKTISKGQAVDTARVVSSLRRSGYSEDVNNRNGYYKLGENVINVHPGPDSYLHKPAAKIQLANGKVTSITDSGNRETLNDYQFDPQLLSNLSGEVRERRRLVRHGEIPKVLVNALLAAEDRKFFDHWGFDIPRIAMAVFVNIRSGHREQGGSTITMQLARNIWLSPDKTWRRKVTESIITMILEQRLSKEEILEHYANQIYLGNHGSFEIHGFGEAAWRYFNRDIGSLTLPQAALLAGLIQRPNYFDPVRHPDRALQRRNTILSLMQRNEFISQAELEKAVASPIAVRERTIDAGDAPYFVDLAIDQAEKIPQAQRGSVRIYTTVDPDLQSAAAEAVRLGMERVDKLVEKKGAGLPRPQVALVALDAHTGEVRAAVGGRNYGASQLNRVLAKRQPGSVFKPFVYAAAMETQLGGKQKQVFTGATLLMDEPRTFKFGDEMYMPGNFGNQFNGPILLRRALTKSLNIPTVSIAEIIGYRRVADVAKRAGIKSEVRGTPAVALGAYEVTPLEMAGAYTVFANQGVHVEPTFLSAVVSGDGKVLFRHKREAKEALDPRVNFLMLDMLQDVLRYGTGAGVWSYGLRAQAAGKTGTSRDGWFAGFTSELICVVWIGYDDHRDLDLEGAKSALPVWGEFMKRATANGAYSKPFSLPPRGLTSAEIDAETGELASPISEKRRTEFFIAGYEPKTEATEESIAAARRTPEELGEMVTLAAEQRAQGGNMGTAVWYRPKDSDSTDEFVGSSPSLPPGARVKVTNMASGKSVVVRINGRIAPIPGVVISVNQKAATELDFAKAGSAQVRIEAVSRTP